eukprot:gb/GFBE01005913.1/.p1 GENE.gb/GFBE01005913.1/~~gb/GFBE01005913.1/.p1  ORF type:complete len:238 (+),score=60.05 gb/GFBE01005913.1/:1-714(+)
MAQPTKTFKREFSRKDALEAQKEIEMKRSEREIQAYLNAVDSANQYSGDEEVIHQFCFAMAYGSARMPSFVVKANGLQTLVQAMNRFPKNERLLAEACEALRNVVEMPDGADAVIEAGGIEVCLTAMQMNAEADWVQQEGCGLVCRLITESDKGRDVILKRQGIEVIRNCMESYPKASWVAMWGAQAMKRFAEVDAKRIEDAQGFALIETARASKAFAKGCPAVKEACTDCLKLRPQ